MSRRILVEWMRNAITLLPSISVMKVALKSAILSIYDVEMKQITKMNHKYGRQSVDF